MQKKIVAATLILIFLINTISPSLIYAKEMFAATYEIAATAEDLSRSNNPDNADDLNTHINNKGQDIVKNATENALAEVRSEGSTRMVSIGNTTSMTEPILGILSTIFNIFPTIVNYIMTAIVRTYGTNDIHESTD